jgi:phosphohistidine phosphatase
MAAGGIVMKTLYLLRHAKSSWDDPELSDLERPLNKRGQRDAPLMGKRLADQKIKLDAILTSPAQRTVETALHIARGLKIPKREIRMSEHLYPGTIGDLLLAIRSCPDKIENLLVIGHNPAITELVNLLGNFESGAEIESLPTCGIVAFEFSCSAWQKIKKRKGQMLFFDYPKNGKPPV